MVAVTIALLTTYLTDYRLPLFRRLAHATTSRCSATAAGTGTPPPGSPTGRAARGRRVPRRRLGGIGEALRVGRDHDAVIAPFAGGALLPRPTRARGASAGRSSSGFDLASAASAAHALALPVSRHIYRHADAVVAYGSTPAGSSPGPGHDDDVFVAPSQWNPSCSRVTSAMTRSRRSGPSMGWVTDRSSSTPGGWCRQGNRGSRAGLAAGPREATLVLVGDGPLRRGRCAGRRPAVGPLPRERLAVAYAAAEFALLPSIPTRASASRGDCVATRRCTRAGRWWRRPRWAPWPAASSGTARPAWSWRPATRWRWPARSTSSWRTPSSGPAGRRGARRRRALHLRGDGRRV